MGTNKERQRKLPLCRTSIKNILNIVFSGFDQFRIECSFSTASCTDLLGYKTLSRLSGNGVDLNEVEFIRVILDKEIHTDHTFAILADINLTDNGIRPVFLFLVQVGWSNLLSQSRCIFCFKVKEFPRCDYFCGRKYLKLAFGIPEDPLGEFPPFHKLFYQYLHTGPFCIVSFI